MTQRIARKHIEKARSVDEEAPRNRFCTIWGALFDAIAAVDLADCGKLMVCHITAKNEADLSVEEVRVAKLFKSFNGKVDPLHAQAQYMLAAQTGAYKKPEICALQYQRCPYPAEQLSQLLKQ